jgi:hypothetical protein
MIHGVLRNKQQLENLIEVLRQYRLPCKYYLQDIYTGRSLELNAYMWGVVYKMIADHSGHSNQEVHEGYGELFRKEYSESKPGVWELRIKGTSEMDQPELWGYLMKVKADAMIDMRIWIPDPSEVILTDNIENNGSIMDQEIPHRERSVF